MAGKIGIFTCGKEPNYGATLQAMATQLQIEQLGYKTDLIDYSFMDEEEYKSFIKGSLKASISSIVHYRLRKGIHKAFAAFRNEHIKYSSYPVSNPEEFKTHLSEYEKIVVGSDQVWNPELGIDISMSLLDFYREGPAKISYASSFGLSELPENLHKKYADALSQFQSISVREKEGASIVKDLIGRDVPVVVDPTMLLTAEDWEKYERPYETNGKYILIYDMNHSQIVRDIAVSLAKKKQCKVVALSRIILPGCSKIKTLYDVSPSQFIYLIHHAEDVVTDSFHGTVFSVLFHKNFYSVCPARGKKISSRIKGLLQQLDLTSQFVQESKTIYDLDNCIQWDSVSKCVGNMRRESKKYLEKALNNEI